MAPLNLRPLHRNVIFAIENHFSLVKWPPLLLIASSASESQLSNHGVVYRLCMGVYRKLYQSQLIMQLFV